MFCSRCYKPPGDLYTNTFQCVFAARCVMCLSRSCVSHSLCVRVCNVYVINGPLFLLLFYNECRLIVVCCVACSVECVLVWLCPKVVVDFVARYRQIHFTLSFTRSRARLYEFNNFSNSQKSSSTIQLVNSLRVCTILDYFVYICLLLLLSLLLLFYIKIPN